MWEEKNELHLFTHLFILTDYHHDDYDDDHHSINYSDPSHPNKDNGTTVQTIALYAASAIALGMYINFY